jgi:hypothetical protein
VLAATDVAYEYTADIPRHHKSGKEYDRNNTHHILAHQDGRFKNATDAPGSIVYGSHRVDVQIGLAFEYYKQIVTDEQGSIEIPDSLRRSLKAAENMARHYKAVLDAMDRAGNSDQDVLKETRQQMWFAYLHFVEAAQSHFAH